MKKLFTCLVFLLVHLFSSQVITDSVALIMTGEYNQLLYNKYDSEKCFTKGDYVKGIVNSSVIFPYDISKCKRYSGSEEYLVKAYFRGENYFFNMDKSTKMIFDGKILDRENAFEFISNLSGSDKVLLNMKQKDISLIYFDRLKENVVKEISTFKKYGIAIIEAIPVENYSMTSARFEILNTSSKTIKYINFTFYGKNRVNDKVGSNITKRGIGPVESFETAKLDFENVWLTDIVERLKLLSVTITYIDGTVKTINITSNHWIDSDLLYQLENF